MPRNAAFVDSYIPYTFTLDIGVSPTVYTFTAPSFPTEIVALRYASDVCSGTNKASIKVSVDGDDRITGTAADTADTVFEFTTADSGKSLVIGAQAKVQLTITIAGTAASVLSTVTQLILKEYRP